MKLLKTILSGILEKFLSLEEIDDYEIGRPKSILIVRQHNQMGDLLASTPILRAIKEKFPDTDLTAIVSPQNYKAYENNPYLDNLFIFDKHHLFKRKYFLSLRRVLKRKYDLAIVPVVTSISLTSNLLARLSNSRIRIGVKSLNGKSNPNSYFFDRLVELDWREKENTHISLRNLAILEPFGITAQNFQTIIFSNDTDARIAKEFLDSIPGNSGSPVIGLHVGAGKIQNRWGEYKFAELIERLMKIHHAKIYLSRGSRDDDSIIETIISKTNADLKVFTKPGMALLKEVISQSNLFITNDTGPMHAAAATDTATISLFGPTNPYVWAPLGHKKVFISKGENIQNISVDDVYYSAEQLLQK
jgi:heptosyltransferase-2